jgi:hypothetical protein
MPWVEFRYFLDVINGAPNESQETIVSQSQRSSLSLPFTLPGGDMLDGLMLKEHYSNELPHRLYRSSFQ